MILSMCSRRRSAAAAVALALAAAVSEVSAQGAAEARVVVDRAIIWRAFPEAVVRNGTVLEVTAQSQQWYEVVIPESLGGHGERGVIARSQVQLLPGSPEPPAKALRDDPAPPSETLPSPPTRSPSGGGLRAKGFLAVNGIYQGTSNNFRNGATFQANAEAGRFDTNYSVTAGPAFEIAGGLNLSNAFGISASVSRFSRTTPAHFSGAIPHPFFFGQSRVVAGEVSGLTREELALHLQGRMTSPAGKWIQVSVFGGPSLFNVKQDAVTDFTYTESYPYDQATFATTSTTTEKASKIGFNGGADIAVFFNRQVGIGFTALVSKATLSIKGAGSGSADVKAGGVQTGGGLRLRF